jgi:hypothetical protein
LHHEQQLGGQRLQVSQVFTSSALLTQAQTQALALPLPRFQEPLQEEPFVSMDTETNKPLLIQIDDEVREMTPEEVEAYEASIVNSTSLPSAE